MKKITTLLLVCVFTFPSCGRLDTADVNIDEGRKEGISKHGCAVFGNGYKADEWIKCGEAPCDDTYYDYKKILFFDGGKYYITEKAVIVNKDKGEYFVRPLSKNDIDKFNRMCGHFIYRTKHYYVYKHYIEYRQARYYIKADSMTFLKKQELDEMIKNNVHPDMVVLSYKK